MHQCDKSVSLSLHQYLCNYSVSLKPVCISVISQCFISLICAVCVSGYISRSVLRRISGCISQFKSIRVSECEFV